MVFVCGDGNRLFWLAWTYPRVASRNRLHSCKSVTILISLVLDCNELKPLGEGGLEREGSDVVMI